MKLTESERERLTDGMWKVESVRRSLKKIDTKKMPTKAELEECLESVDDSIKKALGNKPDE